MKALRRFLPCMVDAYTLPLFPFTSPRAQSIIETVRKSCDIDQDGHWIWQGRVRRRGKPSPCMAYEGETRQVRQVLQSVLEQEHPHGMPLLARCGNPLCVAPGCIQPKRNADLMTEARLRKAQSPIQIPQHKGMWGQLINAGGK